MHRALITFDVQEVSEKAAVHVNVPVGKAREKLFNNYIEWGYNTIQYNTMQYNVLYFERVNTWLTQ